MKEKDPLTERIISCCFKVHNELGPGFSEKIYHRAFEIAFKENALSYETEKAFAVSFRDKKIGFLRFRLNCRRYGYS